MEQKENTNIVHLLRHVVSHAMTDRLDLSSKLFQTMDSADFMLMLILARHSQADQKKIYMKDLAEETKLPLRRVSDIARTLASQEWVSWKFDGNGDEGTYLEITESGLDVTKKQKESLETFYQKVIDKFGQDRFIQMMKDISDLEEIMNNMVGEMEE